MEPPVTVTCARHAWCEKDGFTINRPNGIPVYTFLHFFNPVELLVDGKTEVTPPDCCIFYSAYTPQWYRSIGPLQHNWMHMTGEVAASLKAAGIPENTPFFPAETNFITDIHKELEFALISRPRQNQLLFNKYQELLIKLALSCNNGQRTSAMKPATEAVLRKVRTQVFSQLSRNWTVADMADLAYMSASRFHTLYRNLFGISPVEDLIRARIDTAQYWLNGTELPLHTLSEQLGYRSVTHFCRQFKQYTGTSPSEFRQEQQSQENSILRPTASGCREQNTGADAQCH